VHIDASRAVSLATSHDISFRTTVDTSFTAAMNLDSHAAPQPKKSMWKGFQEMSGVHHPFVIKKLTVKVGESIKGSGKDDKGKYEIKGKVQHDHTL